MAKKTKTDQVKVAVDRLLRDEEVQGHLRTAAARLQEAGSRVRGRRASKAVQDEKLYTKVREAATSLTKAGRSLRGKPEPKKRGRKLVVAALAAGGAVFAIKKRGGGQPASV